MWSKTSLIISMCVLSRSVMSDSCNPIDCSLPGSSICGILQARILEWGAISFSRGSSPPRNWTWVSCIAGGLFTYWAIRELNKKDVISSHVVRSFKNQVQYLGDVCLSAWLWEYKGCIWDNESSAGEAWCMVNLLQETYRGRVNLLVCSQFNHPRQMYWIQMPCVPFQLSPSA